MLQAKVVQYVTSLKTNVLYVNLQVDLPIDYLTIRIKMMMFHAKDI